MAANIAAAAAKLAEPFARELGLTVWDVRFVKEGGSMILRFLIDKEGGINITDCEAFSRAVDGPLDEADFISCSYCLEVSSTGPERELTRPEHFRQMIGRPLKVTFIRPLENGQREFEGVLTDYQDGVSTLECEDGVLTFRKSETAHIRLNDEVLFNGGMMENESGIL